MPLSPRIRTVDSVGATRSICRATVCRAGLRPISSPKAPAPETSSRRYSFSSSSRFLSATISANARAVVMAAAAWSAIIRSQPMQSPAMGWRANTASTPSISPRDERLAREAANPFRPDPVRMGHPVGEGLDRDRAPPSARRSPRSGRPSTRRRGPGGTRRRARSTRWKGPRRIVRNWPLTAGIGTEHGIPRPSDSRSNPRWAAPARRERAATRGRPLRRVTISCSSSAPEYSWAMSRSNRFGSSSRDSSSARFSMPHSVRFLVFCDTRNRVNARFHVNG